MLFSRHCGLKILLELMDMVVILIEEDVLQQVQLPNKLGAPKLMRNLKSSCCSYR